MICEEAAGEGRVLSDLQLMEEQLEELKQEQLEEEQLEQHTDSSQVHWALQQDRFCHRLHQGHRRHVHPITL